MGAVCCENGNPDGQTCYGTAARLHIVALGLRAATENYDARQPQAPALKLPVLDLRAWGGSLQCYCMMGAARGFSY